MNSQDRLARLRSVARQLEQERSSPERDTLLRDVRARIALLEGGTQETTGWSQRGWSTDQPADPFAAVLLHD